MEEYMIKSLKKICLLSASFFMVFFSLDGFALSHKCVLNQDQDEVCVFDLVMLPSFNPRSAVPYSTVIGLFENADGILMAKVSRPRVLGSTHTPSKRTITILPVDDLILKN